MNEETNRRAGRADPRPVLAPQKAWVTHGKRLETPAPRREAARVIPRDALLSGSVVPSVRRGGVVAEGVQDCLFEGWDPLREPQSTR